jgi:protein O-mannosyl-transferase
LVVGVAAIVVHLGALANRFAMDDIPLVVRNPLVQNASGVWRAFAAPFWPPDLGGHMYRPLVVAGWVLDQQVGGAWWFHLINLLWHAAACVVVAALARRYADYRAALIAGLLFAVHPVHVEAVANIVGRAELMSTLFAVLSVYAALARGSLAWSLAAWVAALLSKENAAVAPALVVWGWILGLGRPPRRRMLAFAAGWLVVGAAYAVLRWRVLEPYAGFQSVAPAFLGESAVAIRLTAVAELADLARLLVFPLTLRVDYSPNERTLVTSPLDARFLAGCACVLLWGALLALVWRRGRRLEAFGLGWIGIAFLPVANLVFPVGFLLAERTVYLPSAGLALAAGAWLARWAARWRLATTTTLVLAGALRTALRAPVWRDNTTVTLSILEDSPRSYVGPKRMVAVYLNLHQPEKALEAALQAAQINGRDPTIFVTGAVAAYGAGRPATADSLLSRMEALCPACLGYYRQEAVTAREHGYLTAADSLESRARDRTRP